MYQMKHDRKDKFNSIDTDTVLRDDHDNYITKLKISKQSPFKNGDLNFEIAIAGTVAGERK